MSVLGSLSNVVTVAALKRLMPEECGSDARSIDASGLDTIASCFRFGPTTSLVGLQDDGEPRRDCALISYDPPRLLIGSDTALSTSSPGDLLALFISARGTPSFAVAPAGSGSAIALQHLFRPAPTDERFVPLRFEGPNDRALHVDDVMGLEELGLIA